MAVPPHVFSTTVNLGGVTYSAQASKTSTQLVETTEAIATASTNSEVNIAIDVSEVVSFVIVSTAACTVKINDGTTPDYTYTLVANVPQFWHDGMGTAFTLTTDVTAVYITNTSGTTANVTISAYQDATP
jgi:hypothetical protein